MPSKRILNNDNAGGAYLDRWACTSCKKNLLARWNDELQQPHELIHLTEFPCSPMTLSTKSGETYTVVREEAEELTDAHITAYMLNREAKQRDFAIGTYNVPPHKADIVVDGNEAIGYLLWCESRNGEMVLRELFIREPYRRLGIGSAIVEHWWEDIAASYCEDADEDYYWVEEPNETMVELIVSLGHDGND